MIFRRILLTLLILQFTTSLYAQQKRVRLGIEVFLRSTYIYNKQDLYNADNIYDLSGTTRPGLGMTASFPLNRQLYLSSGLNVSSSAYNIDFDHSSDTSTFNQRLRIRIRSYKLPVGFLYHFKHSKFLTGAGLILNLHKNGAYNIKTNFGGDNNFDVGYDGESFFSNKLTLSGYALLGYTITKKVHVFFSGDADFGHLPNATFSHIITDGNSGVTTTSAFSGAPKIMSWDIGLKLNK